MSQLASAERTASVRAFNRFYTARIGVLDEGLLRSPYSLTEARVLFELAQRDTTEVTALRPALRIDAGYLSRLLARFEADGLIQRQRSETDARRQTARLTEHGRGAFAMLDQRSAAAVATLLSGLSEPRQRQLVAAMDAIRDVLEAAPRPQPFLLREPGPGDLGWVVQRHGELYAREFGWDETFEALVARIVGEYVEDRDPRRERAWIADVDGAAVGCVFCVRADERTAQLRLLLVDPAARGMGIGAGLVDACLGFARQADYATMTLWTNDVLEGARRIYERAGFRLLDAERHHSFGHDLVGQHWSRDL